MINNERSARLKQKSAAVENFSAWCKFATLVQALLAVVVEARYSGIGSKHRHFCSRRWNHEAQWLAIGRANAIAVIMVGAADMHAAEAPVSSQELRAKIDYCKTCHGVSGQGYRGAFPMPRLAGQQPEYLENQLKAFIERRRTNPVMANVAHVLNGSMLTGLAAHFKDLNPKPLGGAPKEVIAAGKKIYDEGVPSTDIPPCASCHGAGAKGDGAFPRLAGQLHDYIMRKLMNWSKERGQDPARPDTSAIMEPIAHGLTEPQIAAVAAYLSYLE